MFRRHLLPEVLINFHFLAEHHYHWRFFSRQLFFSVQEKCQHQMIYDVKYIAKTPIFGPPKRLLLKVRKTKMKKHLFFALLEIRIHTYVSKTFEVQFALFKRKNIMTVLFFKIATRFPVNTKYTDLSTFTTLHKKISPFYLLTT